MGIFSDVLPLCSVNITYLEQAKQLTKLLYLIVTQCLLLPRPVGTIDTT